MAHDDLVDPGPTDHGALERSQVRPGGDDEWDRQPGSAAELDTVEEAATCQAQRGPPGHSAASGQPLRGLEDPLLDHGVEHLDRHVEPRRAPPPPRPSRLALGRTGPPLGIDLPRNDQADGRRATRLPRVTTHAEHDGISLERTRDAAYALWRSRCHTRAVEATWSRPSRDNRLVYPAGRLNQRQA